MECYQMRKEYQVVHALVPYREGNRMITESGGKRDIGGREEGADKRGQNQVLEGTGEWSEN